MNQNRFHRRLPGDGGFVDGDLEGVQIVLVLGVPHEERVAKARVEAPDSVVAAPLVGKAAILHPGEIGRREVGAAQVGAGDVGAGEIGAREVRLREVGIGQIRFFEIDPVQGRAPKVGLPRVGRAKIRSGQVRLDEARFRRDSPCRARRR